MTAPALPDEAERAQRPPAFVEEPDMAVGEGPRPILLLEGDNHDALRWLTRGELYAVPWLPADLPIVRAAEGRLRA